MKGLAVPIVPGPDGRTKTLSGDDELEKIIRLNLGDLENDNPYTQWGGASKGEPGIDPGIIFSLSVESLQERIKTNIKLLFDRLSAQGRAKLVTGYPKMVSDSAKMELLCGIRYLNLESDKENEFEHRFEIVEGK